MPNPAPALLVAPLAILIGCASTEDDPLDPTVQLEALEARVAAAATEDELGAANLFFAVWLDGLEQVPNLPPPTGLAKPESHVLATLFEQRSPIFGGDRGLPAVHLAQLINARPSSRLDAALVAGLDDTRGAWRAYSCELLGFVEVEDTDELLAQRLTDGTASVALSAAGALAQRGDARGLSILLDDAAQWQREGEQGPLPHRHHFARFARADFGDELETYVRWFEQYPPADR